MSSHSQIFMETPYPEELLKRDNNALKLISKEQDDK